MDEVALVLFFSHYDNKQYTRDKSLYADVESSAALGPVLCLGVFPH